MAVYDSAGKLVYWSRGGGVDDDQPRPLSTTDLADLSRGSLGQLDPYIGSVDLEETNGKTYYVAVSSNAYIPIELNQFSSATTANALMRLEPVAEYNRIFINRVEDNTSGQPTINLNADKFNLGDVVLFVTTAGQDLLTADPGAVRQETNITPDAQVLPFVINGAQFRRYSDITMRNDGLLFAISAGNTDALAGNLVRINTGDGTGTIVGDDGIATYGIDPESGDLVVVDRGILYNALALVKPIRRIADCSQSVSTGLRVTIFWLS